MNFGTKQPGTKQRAWSRRPRMLGLVAVAAAGAIVVGLSAPALANTARPNAHLAALDTVSKSNPLQIWVDPPRIPAVQAFEKLYPNIPLNVTTLSSSASNAGLEEKFTLFNRSAAAGRTRSSGPATQLSPGPPRHRSITRPT